MKIIKIELGGSTPHSEHEDEKVKFITNPH